MEQALEHDLLDYAGRKLRQLTGRIRECVAPLTPEQLWWRAVDGQNATGNLMLHLAGNVRQWIISGAGGAPDVRVREREFSARGGAEAAEMLERLESTVEEAAGVLERLPPGRLAERVTIQNYDITVMEAIIHVVEHFSQHVGQIILLSKLMRGASPGFYRHLDEAGPHGEKTP